MRRRAIQPLALGLLLVAVSAFADQQQLAANTTTKAASGQVTFTKDVLPILQDNCQNCHRPSGANMAGMIAPMSLMTYKEVRPWAKAMSRAVAAKKMPPWHASPDSHGVFGNERTLTEEQISTITRWVETGARRGKPSDAPKALNFSETGWSMGKPDLVLDFDEPFFVKDKVEDLYQNITVTLTEDQLPEDKWLSAIELKPGSEVVHHIILYAAMPGDDSEPNTSGMIGGIAPGTEADTYPEGFGILLRKGSRVTFQMHYHKESGPGTGAWDSSQAAFKFQDKPVTHPVEISNISYGNFEIPPYHKNWRVGAAEIIKEDTLLLSLLPHTHLRGSSARYTAFYPDGSSEVLLHVPEYDFNWQTGYAYKEPKFIPEGTRLEMELFYDNSQERGEFAGIDPSRPVRFGGPTTDEMDLAWMITAPAKPADTVARANNK
jgi:mono/diheme cytochrome c family protein